MAALGSYAEKFLLDYINLGSTTTRPAAWGAGLSLGSPTSASGSEVSTASGYTRQSVTFGAAASPGGSATNANAMTYGPFSTAQSLSGLVVWDTVLSANSGNLLWYGLLATARTVGVGDSLVVASAGLTVSLS